MTIRNNGDGWFDDGLPSGLGTIGCGTITSTLPEYAWRCHLCYGTSFPVEEGKQPNSFHRFMQRLFFGITWEKLL